MFFYALFAVGLLARRVRVGALAVVAGLALLVAGGLIFRPTDIVLSFYARPIVLEFALGILLGLVWRWAPISGWIRPTAWLVLAVSGAVFLFGPGAAIGSSILGYGLLATLIVASSLVLERQGVVASWPVLQRLGDASYAIYLTHFFVIRGFEKLTARVPQNTVTLAAMMLVAFVLCALAGIMVHRWIERPMTGLLRRWWSAPASPLAPAPAPKSI
jgi:peptidoglycan/LPS O-acetylase OafA/YrhL